MVNSEMRISQVSPSHAPKAHNQDSLTKRPNGVKTIGGQENDQLKQINSLDLIKSRLNAIAKNIRSADKTFKTIEDYIDKMNTELGKIIKKYPPFPRGSEERVKLLKSYISLRKLIDQLTIPPPGNEFSIKIVSDYEFVPETGTWDVLTDPNNISIPDLSENATDEDIVTSIAKLETVKEMILRRGEELAGEAEKINSQQKDVLFSKLFPGYGDELADPELMSVEMGRTLSKEPEFTLSQVGSQLISLLE